MQASSGGAQPRQSWQPPQIRPEIPSQDLLQISAALAPAALPLLFPLLPHLFLLLLLRRQQRQWQRQLILIIWI